MGENFLESARCPACGGSGMEHRSETIELPYLGESLETMIRCRACGYRHTDFILTEIKAPTRWRLRVAEERHMSVRVVRASSGTVRIPELGIDIEPGVASDAYITNVEGILRRIEGVLGQLRNDAGGDKESIARIDAITAHFDALRDGDGDPVTLVIEDPFGNSTILDKDAESETIPEAEAARLKVGAFVLDQSDLGSSTG